MSLDTFSIHTSFAYIFGNMIRQATTIRLYTLTTLLLLLYCICNIHPAAAFIDFCHSDPRLTVTYHNCTSSSDEQSVLVYQPDLPDNELDALLGPIWAVAYYMQYCVREYEIVTLSIPSSLRPLPQRSACENGTAQWSACALSAITQRTADTSTCYARRVQIGTYGEKHTAPRELQWYGRYCQGVPPRCDPDLKAQFIPLLDERRVTSTLRFIRSSLFDFLRLPSSTPDTKTISISLSRAARQCPLDPKLNVSLLPGPKAGIANSLKTYASTDVLIARESAGMVNILFLPEGADVLIVSRRPARDRFVPAQGAATLARYLGLHVTYVQCYHANTAKGSAKGNGNGNGGQVKNRPGEFESLFGDAVFRQTRRLSELRDNTNAVGDAFRKSGNVAVKAFVAIAFVTVLLLRKLTCRKRREYKLAQLAE